LSIPISEVQRIVSDAHFVFVNTREKIILAIRVMNSFGFEKSRNLLEQIDEDLTKVIANTCEQMNELEDSKVKE
jgi:DNA-directed RNA polymerase alpha subunit